MVGKFTDFYVWSKVLSKTQVQSMANCTLKIRKLFNDEVKLQTSASRIFNAGRKNRRSGFMWAGRNVVYGWSIDTISLQRPATLEVSGDLCGELNWSLHGCWVGLALRSQSFAHQAWQNPHDYFEKVEEICYGPRLQFSLRHNDKQQLRMRHY